VAYLGVIEVRCNATNTIYKLCSVGELNKRLDSKSMEIRWNIYIKGVDNKGVID
jgi:hypothetical protein